MYMVSSSHGVPNLLEVKAHRASGSTEFCSRYSLHHSEMAGPIELKLGVLIENSEENVLVKKFFVSTNIHRGQVGGPQVPLLDHLDEIETPN